MSINKFKENIEKKIITSLEEVERFYNQSGLLAFKNEGKIYVSVVKSDKDGNISEATGKHKDKIICNIKDIFKGNVKGITECSVHGNSKIAIALKEIQKLYGIEGSLSKSLDEDKETLFDFVNSAKNKSKPRPKM